MKKGLMIFIFFIIFALLGCQTRDVESVIKEIEETGYIVEAKDNEYIGMMRAIKPELSEFEAEYSIYSEGELQVGYIMVFTSHEDAMTYYEEADLGDCVQYNGVYGNFFINTLDVELYELVMDTTVETTLDLTTAS